MYRQVQSFADSRSENLKRPERVAETAARDGVIFRSSENKSVSSKEKDMKKDAVTYGPGSRNGKQKVYYETGTRFSAVA